METLSLEFWKEALLDLTKAVENEKDHLCQLDGAIGDGDHGASMALGLREVARHFSAESFPDIGALLRMTGNTFIGSVGGVTGIIFGTLFVNAGEKAEGKTEVNTADLAAMFEFALEGIKVRGKVNEGDKSMVDALSPAVKTLKDAAQSGLKPDEALIMAKESAEQGMESTRKMLPKVGRARYQGEKGIGHIDPGAVSVVLIFRILVDTINNSRR
jgi:dihydroxyacetone kinase-like protein